MNTGDDGGTVGIDSDPITTMAYSLGEKGGDYRNDNRNSSDNKGNVMCALEGSVSHCGRMIQRLVDRLRILRNTQESETMAKSLIPNNGIYLFPPFSALFAIHWKYNSRGCIVGMTTTHDRRHLFRAVLEASPYQARELFNAVREILGVDLTKLRVDRSQCNVMGREVVVPTLKETTTRGSAFAAGLAMGVWENTKNQR